jgi:hypothetical protein
MGSTSEPPVGGSAINSVCGLMNTKISVVDAAIRLGLPLLQADRGTQNLYLQNVSYTVSRGIFLDLYRFLVHILNIVSKSVVV